MKNARLLVLCDYYAPGFRAGGPQRSVFALVQEIEKTLNIGLLTRDTDQNAPAPYSKLEKQRAQSGSEKLIYLPAKRLAFAVMQSLQREAYDALMLNSLFSLKFSIWPLLLRRLGLIPFVPVALTTRGETAPSALKFKSKRKQIYLRAACAIGLFKNTLFHASSEYEAQDIHNLFKTHGFTPNIAIVPDLVPAAPKPQFGQRQVSGPLQLVFLSRISPIKGLDFVLSVLSTVKTPVHFAIFGPLKADDESYWQKCQQLIKDLPPHIHARYHGAVSGDTVLQTLARYPLFILPTEGENFGQAIVEAMLAGCTVLISNRTPHRDLEAKGAGWDLPLENSELWRACIENCAHLSTEEWREREQQVLKYADQISDQTNKIKALHLAFTRLLGGSSL